MRDTYFQFEIPVLWNQVQTETIKADRKMLSFKDNTYVLEYSIDDCDTLSAKVSAATWS